MKTKARGPFPFRRGSACAGRCLVVTLTLGLVLALMAGMWVPVAYAKPAEPAVLLQTYFVPGPEAQIRDTLLALYSGTGSVLRSVVSIAATADNTLIYYDHWEDGYELDIEHPTQGTTQVWGDNNAANGIPPGFASDVIHADDIVALENDVALPRNATEIRYDGGDKFGVNKGIAVTRAGWAITPGPVLAGAMEVQDTGKYGTHFEAPVGVDVNAHEMFEYVGLLVMAAQNGTVVQIDRDGNGTVDVTQTLNQGQSAQVNGGIRSGATVTASRPVQVHLITGDISTHYESRWYMLYPTTQWDDSYYNPVGSTAVDAYTGNPQETYVFLYNPNGSLITVQYQTQAGGGSFAVSAGGVYQYEMPPDSGAHFYTGGGGDFFAIATVGAGIVPTPEYNNTYDWGFSLVPGGNLTPVAVVGWGPGTADRSANGSPAWVMAVNPTTLYVDYDGDPTTGPLTDPHGSHYDVSYTLAAYQSQKVFDNTDNDQTGMRLYTVDDTLITAAWGEDPATAGAGNPYLDLGTTILPFVPDPPQIEVVKTLQVPPDGVATVNETVTFAIRVANTGPNAITQLRISDSYDSACMRMTAADVMPDSPAGGPPWAPPVVWDASLAPFLPLPSGEELTLTVDFLAHTPSQACINTATVTGVDEYGQPVGPLMASDDVLIEPGGVLGDLVWWDVNGNGQQDGGEPGLANVLVNLYNGSAVKVATDITDGSGLYRFEELWPDTYRIEIDPSEFLPGGTLHNWTASPQNVGPDTTDSDGDPITHDVTTTVVAAEVDTSNDFGFDVVSDYEISKRLNSFEPLVPGEPVSFTIRITNTGDSWITALPLRDTYDPTYLTYGFGGQFADPDSDDHINDGQIDWSDLTVSFGSDLAPGASFTVNVFFTAKEDTTLLEPDGRTINTAMVHDALADPDGPGPLGSEGPLPQKSDSAGVLIFSPGKSSIGDTVWRDSDGDGEQDAGEAGIDGVLVNLYLDDGDASFEPGTDDTFQDSMTTGENPSAAGWHGWYDFVGLAANGLAYWVEIDDSNFAPGGPLEGLALTSQFTYGPEPMRVLLWDVIVDYDNADFGYARPAIDLVKTAGNAPDGGIEYIRGAGNVVFHYTVANVGETYLSNIVVSDDVHGAVCTIAGPLAPAASRACDRTFWVDGDETNWGTATGNPTDSTGNDIPDIPNVSDTDDAVVEVVNPAIDLVKTAGNAPDGGIEYIRGAGNVAFHYTVTNVGDTYLSSIVVSDDVHGAICTIAGPLAPAASQACDRTFWVAGDETNWGTATGNPTDSGGNDLPDIADVSDSDDAVVEVVNPAIDLVKTAGDALDGEVERVPGPPPVSVTFHYLVTNVGDTHLSNIVVNDDIHGYICTIAGPLAPAASQSCDGTFAVFADETNWGTATGNPTDGAGNDLPDIPDVSDSDDARVEIEPVGSLGDLVWWDVNGNGQQNSGEPGIPDVLVNLYDGSAVKIATGVTDGSGFYRFDTLRSGTYRIEIDPSEFLPGGTLHNWYASPRNLGPDATDSDGHLTTHDIVTLLSPGEQDMTNDFGFDILPDYRISKRLNTVEPASTGQAVSFTIRITNTGGSWITVLPLRDTYDPVYLTYGYAAQFARPDSDDHDNDGQIDWSDLTVSLGTDLAPGASFTVVVTFTARTDTQHLPDRSTENWAIVHDAIADADGPGPLGSEGLPQRSDSDTVEIVFPTAVAMASFQAVAQPDGALVQWQTASEVEMLGFYVLRQTDGGEFVAVNEAFIFAEYAGAGQGASYAYVDAGLQAGTYTYTLEVIKLDGSSERYGRAAVTIGG